MLGEDSITADDLTAYVASLVHLMDAPDRFTEANVLHIKTFPNDDAGGDHSREVFLKKYTGKDTLSHSFNPKFSGPASRSIFDGSGTLGSGTLGSTLGI